MSSNDCKESLSIRQATPSDVRVILELIHAIADYEKLSHQVTANEDTLRDSLFGPHPAAEICLASWQGVVVGYAVFFHHFSTFEGQRGLYLEDIFIQPDFRGKGIGKALLRHLARLALERDCARFEWLVLDWNQAAMDFYRGLGAEILDDWKLCRMTASSIQKLAHSED